MQHKKTPLSLQDKVIQGRNSWKAWKGTMGPYRHKFGEATDDSPRRVRGKK